MSTTTVGDIDVGLTLDDKGYTVTVSRAGQTLRTFSQSLAQADSAMKRHEQHHQGLLTTFRHFVVMLGAARFALMDFNDVILGLPRSIVKTSGELERMTVLMEGLSRAVGAASKKTDAANSFDFIIGAAKRVPFDIKAISDSFVKLKASGIDPTKGAFDALSGSVARFGGDSETLKRATVAVMQMAGKGVISMEELRQQLGEAVPTAMQMMADGAGYSMREFVKHVSKGEVQAREALERMFVQMRIQNEGAAARMMQTWTGLQQQLKTVWQLLENEAGKGFMGALKESTRELMDALQSDQARRVAHELGAALKTAILYGAEFIKKLYEMADVIKTFAYTVGIYFGATHIGKFVTSFYETVAQGFNRSLAAQRAGLAEHARVIAQEAALETERLAKRLTDDQVELARAREKYAVLESELAQHNARMRNLETLGAAGRYAAGTTINGTAVGGRFVNQTEVAAQIAASNAAAAGVARQIANNQTLQQSIAKNVASHEAEIAALAQKATAATAAAGAMGRLSFVSAGLRGLLAALGGPMGALILALSIGIPLWLEWGRRGEEAIKRVKSALESGTADKDTMAEIDRQITAKQLAVENATKTLETIKAGKPLGFGSGTMTKEEAQKLLDQAKADLKAWEDKKVEGWKQVGENTARAARAAVEKEFEAIRQTSAEKYNDMIDEIKSKREQLESDTTLKPEQKAAQLTAYAHEIQLRAADAAKAQLEAMRAARDRMREMLKTATGDDAKLIADKIKVANKLISEQMDFTHNAVKFSEGQMKMESKAQRVSPLDKAFESAKRQMDEAMDHLHEIEDRSVTVSEVYDRVSRRVWHMLQGGQYDTTVNNQRVRPKITDPRIEAEKFYLTVAEVAKRNNGVMNALNKDLEKSFEDLRNASDRFWDPDNAEKQNSLVLATQRNMAKLHSTLVDTRDGLRKQLANPKLTAGMTLEQIQEIRENMAELDRQIRQFETDAPTVISNTSTTALENWASDLRATTETLMADAIVNPVERARTQMDKLFDRLKGQFERMRETALEGLELNSPEYAEKSAAIERAYAIMLEHMGAKRDAFMRDHKSALDQMVDQWQDRATQMDHATTQWAQNGMNAIMEFVKTGKFNFNDLATSIIADIIRIELQARLAAAFRSMFGILLGAMGLGGSQEPELLNTFAPVTPNAMGGVMTANGPMALKRYAHGGIATSPQMALFGEGSRPEAYVPLPDGRSIPVNMKGGQNNVVVNVINQTGTPVSAEQGRPHFDGKQLILDVVLSAANSPGPFRDSMKGALK